MSNKLYIGTPKANREMEAKTLTGGFGEYRADAGAPIAAASNDTTFWQNSVAPREETYPFHDAAATNHFQALENMHIMGSLNMKFTWAITPTAGSTVLVSVLSSYATPDSWIAEQECVVNGNSLSISLSMGDFLPKGEYWEVFVTNNTDEELLLYGKMMLYRVG